MIIESPLEFEILGALHALAYDANNKLKEQTIIGSTFYSYFKKLRPMEHLNIAFESLDRKGIIKAQRSRTAGNIEEMKFGSISPTERGEKIILAVVEPYWVYIKDWKVKYPKIQQQLIPDLKEPDDWFIFKTLYENTTWLKDYRIDDEEARSIIDKGRKEELPFYGKFKDKFWRSSQRLGNQEQRQNEAGRFLQVIKLNAWYKPLATENFNAFNTAREYYKSFLEMYAETQYSFYRLRPFLNILKKYVGDLPENLNLFFDHLITIGLFRSSVSQTNMGKSGPVQISLDSQVDSQTWEEWEQNVILSRYNPQASLLYQLRNRNTVELNYETLELEVREKESISSELDSVLVSGEEAFLKPKPKLKNLPKETNKTIFVVYGRNDKIRSSMFEFLRSVGLKPLEWNEAMRATGKTSPYIGEVLNKAFEIAQAVVLLFTPDDEARLNEEFHLPNEPEYEKRLMPQARPNVLFEAGMAMGRAEDRTILAVFGDLRPFTDVLGRHEVRMSNSLLKREELLTKLETAGCPVDKSNDDWQRIGDFSLPFPKEKTAINVIERSLFKLDISTERNGPNSFLLKITNNGDISVLNLNFNAIADDGSEAPIVGMKSFPIKEFPPDSECNVIFQLRLGSSLSYMTTLTWDDENGKNYSKKTFISGSFLNL